MIRSVPATGSCRWLPDTMSGNRRLVITTSSGSREYEVEQVEGGFDLLYREDDLLTSRMKFYRYQVRLFPRSIWTCSCLDATQRRQCNCKHVRALRAALAALPF